MAVKAHDVATNAQVVSPKEKPVPQEDAKSAPQDDAKSDPQDEAESPPQRKATLIAKVDAKPIPQDDAKVAQRERERLEWHLRTSVGAYDKVGKRDPRWDNLARTAIDLAIRQSYEPGSKITTDQILRAAKAAKDAGCDDPLVAHLYDRMSGADPGLGIEKAARLQRDSTKAYAASRYPAFRRAGTLESFANMLMSVPSEDDSIKNEINTTLDASLAILSEGAKSDEHNGFWADRWLDVLINTIKDYRRLGVAPEAAYERVDAKMAGIPELEELRLLTRGRFWFDYGWEARTRAFAPEVPADGFRLLGERLTISKESFEKAWELRPENASAATFLIDIDKSINGDRDTMELWFDRAMKADGDRRNACATKLDWLDPKWHGTVEEMVAFGRTCRDTKNWRAGITILCADAHLRAACMPDQDQNEYLKLAEVWADIQSVYDEYLKHYPEDHVARSKFATLCFLGAHYREAEVQYVALGDHLTQWSDFPYFPLGQMKQNRKRNAKVVMGKDGVIAFPGWHFVASTSGDGEWRVHAPAALQHKTSPGILGPDECRTFSCSAEGIAYEFRVEVLPPDILKDAPERILESARSASSKERGVKPRDRRDTLLGARPAQEYDADVPGPKPTVRRVKTVVIGNCLFELSVTGDKRDLTSRSAEEFFASFAYQPKSE
ncbi:hypothetical protein ACYOEI_11180 [Singulisphaera rosea]